MLRFKCYGLRFEWLKLKFNSGFYPREGRYAVINNSRAESRFERSVTMPLAFFFSLISGPKSVENRSKYVSR